MRGSGRDSRLIWSRLRAHSRHLNQVAWTLGTAPPARTSVWFLRRAFDWAHDDREMARG